MIAARSDISVDLIEFTRLVLDANVEAIDLVQVRLESFTSLGRTPRLGLSPCRCISTLRLRFSLTTFLLLLVGRVAEGCYCMLATRSRLVE